MKREKLDFWHCIGEKIVNSIKFIIKVIEVIVIIWILLLPILAVNFIEEELNINYNKYIKLLSIVLDSKYIWVCSILIVVVLFKKEFSTKIMQLSKVTGMEFDLQTQKIYENGYSKSEKIIIENVQETKINQDIKKEFSEGDPTEEEMCLNTDLIEQNNKLLLENTKYKMAKTTAFVIVSAYIDNKIGGVLTKVDIEKYLKDYIKNKGERLTRSQIKKEVNAIIFFLTTSGIAETEDEDNYEITAFGRAFAKYIFEGGV